MGTTGKLFEYMASGKPILALASDTVATQIIEQANIGVSVSPDDKEGIKKVVHELYLKWLSGNLVLNPNEEVIARYDVRKLAKRFGEILDEILS
jgi:glycosyltransferase involved in cell wall biosynthesis